MSVKRDLQNASAWEAELNKERAGALGMTAREESERQRWNLCVQREAIGARRHEDVDRLYPIAPKLE